MSCIKNISRINSLWHTKLNPYIKDAFNVIANIVLYFCSLLKNNMSSCIPLLNIFVLQDNFFDKFKDIQQHQSAKTTT